MKHPYFRSLGPGIEQLKDGMWIVLFWCSLYTPVKHNDSYFAASYSYNTDQSLFILDGIKLAKDPGTGNRGRSSSMGKRKYT